MGALVIPDDAPLHDWAGLAQRIVVLVFLFPARIALGIRLFRTSARTSLVTPARTRRSGAPSLR